MLRPNNNQLYSHYVSLLIPIEYLQYYLQYYQNLFATGSKHGSDSANGKAAKSKFRDPGFESSRCHADAMPMPCCSDPS